MIAWAIAATSACRDPAPAAPSTAPSVPAPVRVVSRDAAVTVVARDAAVRLAPSLPAHTREATQPQGSGQFLGVDDSVALRLVCDGAVERIERNRGGSTLSFRVWFTGGGRGLFKPQQQAQVANFRAELAAFRMSRLLDLDRVPPACGRTMPRAMLQRAADASGDAAFSQRVMTELLGRDEQVPGAMLYWVPGSLEPIARVDQYPQMLDLARPLPPEDTTLAAELSTLVLFDFLNDNVDRWSGGNILRQRGEPGASPRPMLFMDNGASFSALHDGLGARPHDQATRLEAVQRFSHSFVRALRGLTAPAIQRAMSEDPLGPCLSEPQVRAVLARRDRIVTHADEVAAAHGESDVFVFP